MNRRDRRTSVSHRPWLRSSFSRRVKPSNRLVLFSSAALCAIVSSLSGAPVGGTVTSGAGGIVQSGATTIITQTTPTLGLSWTGFNVGAAETVNFVQPSASAIAVNRIHDVNGTQILGHLN